MKIKYRADLGIAWIAASLAGRIGHHHPDLTVDLFWSIGEVESIIVALAHLATVQSRHLRRLSQERLRLGEHRRIEMIEASSDVARQLDMRYLIDAHWHIIALIDDDVGGLQHRVTQKAIIGEVFVFDLLLLLFVAGYPLQPRHRRDHRQ